MLDGVRHAFTFQGGRAGAPRGWAAIDSMLASHAAPRMLPVDVRCVFVARMLAPMFLPQFVGEQRRYDHQRQHEEYSEYDLLDHDSLLAVAGTLAHILGSELRPRSISYSAEQAPMRPCRTGAGIKRDMNMQLQNDTNSLALRPLERQDLRFVHELNNDAKIMRYWFEEPYETFSELSQLYDRHVHDQRERRFVAVDAQGELVGLVELIELDYIHRRGEFQIIIAPQCQGRGYAGQATRLAIEYAFKVLNMRKLYLIVDTSNAAAIHVYEKCGFQHEAELKEEFFGNGAYHNAYRMCIFQRDYFERQQPGLNQAG